MRHTYTLLLYCLLPFLLLRLLWRSHKAPAYRRRWRERFGFYAKPPARLISPAESASDCPQPDCVWIHAVSVGETRAALPLIRALRERYPELPLLITTTTPTGSAQVRASLGDTVRHVYLPYDLPHAIRRFLLRARPRLAIVMETELWPNLFHACAQNAIPLLLANARLSARSARGYRRFAGPLIRQTLANITQIAARSRDDALRFNELGAPLSRLRICGDIKYDLALPEGISAQGRALRQRLFGTRPVLIAASTHAGEEALLLDAAETLRQRLPELLLVLVPRHPERFVEVTALCRQRRLRLVKRSSKRPCDAATQVFLGDSMGELLLLYAAADVAFVGGSLVPNGGHNVLEPALIGLPVLFGPHMDNFTDATQQLLTPQAAWQVADINELTKQAERLLLNDGLRAIAGQRGRAAVEANRGALGRLFDCAEALLSDPQRTSDGRAGQLSDSTTDSAQPRQY